ncbi:hypothetical protein OOZ63_16645 [Paucibacter sp. PLA-PC-4]|uniref:hypothetical protein n=1 Tax=Paucibacter sp. PLA-PC-4 TaxID=2993655 RepID=UPI00224ADEDF|nr:hypothetical protein [Paucibacter sp. PLA-PC-4]MCX2863461.1 hypothetical protein [Paucibacter sp. PLA-PC-4]
MVERRPKWSCLSKGELERQRARLRAKARQLAERLKQRERALGQSGAVDRGLRQMREHIEGMEQAATALHHRARSRV